MADFGAGDRVIIERDGDGKAGSEEPLLIDAGPVRGESLLEDLVPGAYEVLCFPRQEESLRSDSIDTH